MNYEVTIGIPVYQSVDYIEKTMESALNQTFKSIEFLVVDDCGNDGTIKKVERFQNEHPRGKDIHILYNKQNLGVGKTRNIILEQAQGDYLFFLDSDDILVTDAIEKMMGAAHAYQAEVVYGSWTRVDRIHYMPLEHSFYPDIQFLSPDELAMYAFQNYSSFRISVCNALFKLSMIRISRLHFLDAMFWEDLAFTYDLVPRVNRAVLLSDITYHYICRSGSLSHYQDREVLQKEEILNNIQTMNYLKRKSRSLIKKPYASYLSYNLEKNSFYIICHILKNSNRINPKISTEEMYGIIRHPMSVKEILSFHNKICQNLFFWFVGCMPASVTILIIGLLGKLKKII